MSFVHQVREELLKAVSLVVTARRLLETGTMVDLSALDGKVRFICGQAGTLGRDERDVVLPLMERLMGDLDSLSDAIQDRMRPAGDDRPAAP